METQQSNNTGKASINSMEPQKSIHLKGVHRLQREEKVSHFFILVVSLALIILLFIVLWLV